MKKKPAGEAPAASPDTLDGLGIGWYASDLTGTFVAINRVGASLLGYTPEEMIGRVTTVDTNVDQGHRERLKRQADATGELLAFVSPTRRKDGSTFWAEWSVRRRLGPDGEPAGYEGVFRDVTSQMEDARRLRDLLTQLRETNVHLKAFAKVQEELLSALGHDLKTPPGIVMGFCELLLRGRYGEVRPEQERALRAIHRNTAQMSEMLELLLDFSRFLKRLDTSTVEPHLLAPVLDRVFERVGREARARKVRLTPPAVGAGAVTAVSPEVLEPLLEHMIRNAVLLTREGREVSVRAETTGGRTSLCVSVPEPNEEHPPLNRLLSVFFVLPNPPGGSTEREPYRLGFAAARYLAHTIGATVVARSLGDEGFEVQASLPASLTPTPPPLDPDGA